MLNICPPSFTGLIGVSRQDITPPVGIYSRLWGAAKHEVAEGIHRPLFISVITFRQSTDAPPIVLAVLDLCWWPDSADERTLRHHLLDALKLAEERVLISLTHTHAAPVTCRADRAKPGGHLIEPYLERVGVELVSATIAALTTAVPATLSWATGRCALAANRDLPAPEHGGTLCGFNPQAPADDTVLVGRVTDASGRIIATLVNYACHPTTLGPENRLISPDFVGALRATIESQTDGAPCIYLLGAAGDLAPRLQYVGDVAMADKHGQQLAYASIEALESLPPHNRGLRFRDAMDSGAKLAIWEEFEFHPSTALAARKAVCELRVNLPEFSDCLDKSAVDNRAYVERQERYLRRRQQFGDSTSLQMPIWGVRLGDALLLGCPAEAYSEWQLHLRCALPQHPVIAMNLVNGCYGYLATRAAFEISSYAAKISPFVPDSLEVVVRSSICLAEQLLDKAP